MTIVLASAWSSGNAFGAAIRPYFWASVLIALVFLVVWLVRHRKDSR